MRLFRDMRLSCAGTSQSKSHGALLNLFITSAMDIALNITKDGDTNYLNLFRRKSHFRIDLRRKPVGASERVAESRSEEWVGDDPR